MTNKTTGALDAFDDLLTLGEVSVHDWTQRHAQEFEHLVLTIRSALANPMTLQNKLGDLQIRHDVLKEHYDTVCERLSSEMKMTARYRLEAIELQQKLNAIAKIKGE
jgi:hypothetical protein